MNLHNICILIKKIKTKTVYRSQIASEEKLELAKTEVENMEANMGGTEILGPLKNIMEPQDSLKNYPRQVSPKS